MPYQLPPLPYGYEELAPHVGPKTVRIHYDKHHRAYVDKLNELTGGKIGSEEELRELVEDADGDLFNQAAQAWNHGFYWRCMDPEGGGDPGGRLAEELAAHFGSVERFRGEFADAAKGEFGSGWAWLVREDTGKLRVMSTSDADNPLAADRTPLLTIDVWEHAYYLDYQNERAEYVRSFLERLLNWSFVDENLGRCLRDTGGDRLEEMMRHPSEVFDAPGDVLDEPTLSDEQRVKVLEQWRYGVIQLQVATEENLIGDAPEAGILAKIDKALKRLEAN